MENKQQEKKKRKTLSNFVNKHERKGMWLIVLISVVSTGLSLYTAVNLSETGRLTYSAFGLSFISLGLAGMSMISSSYTEKYIKKEISEIKGSLEKIQESIDSTSHTNTDSEEIESNEKKSNHPSDN